MDWTKIIEGLATASPLAGALGYACYVLWGKLSEKDKVIASKDEEIRSLNERRVTDIQAMLKPRS